MNIKHNMLLIVAVVLAANEVAGAGGGGGAAAGLTCQSACYYTYPDGVDISEPYGNCRINADYGQCIVDCGVDETNIEQTVACYSPVECAEENQPVPFGEPAEVVCNDHLLKRSDCEVAELKFPGSIRNQTLAQLRDQYEPKFSDGPSKCARLVSALIKFGEDKIGEGAMHAAVDLATYVGSLFGLGARSASASILLVGAVVGMPLAL